MTKHKPLDPNDIVPVHDVQDDAPLLAQLVEKMKRDGWQDRRLLVEEISVGCSPIQYYGWTGSHRIEAARRAKLPEVPCLVMTAAEMNKARHDVIRMFPKKVLVGDKSFLDLVSHGLRLNDNDGRLKLLMKLGLEEPAEMMRKEVTSDRKREGVTDMEGAERLKRLDALLEDESRRSTRKTDG